MILIASNNVLAVEGMAFYAWISHCETQPRTILSVGQTRLLTKV